MISANLKPMAALRSLRWPGGWRPNLRTLRPHSRPGGKWPCTVDINGLQVALAAGVDVSTRDAKGWTALMANADLNVRAADGATALFMAVLRGYTEIVAALLKAGADISIQGPRGKTALEVAKVQEHPEMTALLEQTGNDDAVFERATSAGTFGNFAGMRHIRKHAGRHTPRIWAPVLRHTRPP